MMHLEPNIWKLMHQVFVLCQITAGKNDMNYGCDEVPDNATLCPTALTSESLLSAEWCYSNIEWEAIGILHGLEKFHNYCFAKEVCVITDHKPLVAIINKDVVTLSQHLQCIMLYIHQYRVCILYKPSTDLYMVESLSQKQPYRKQGLVYY